MRYRKKSIKYTPRSKFYKNNYNIIFKRRLPLLSIKHFKFFNVINYRFLPIIVGSLLMFFGIFNLLKITVVYTPIFFGNSLGNGANFAASSILLLLGVGIIFLNKKSLLGYLFIIIGFSIVIISIFLSLKMRFLPTPLFKTLLIFSSIIGGFCLLIKTAILLSKK
ncbi:Uncharacterised protein [uncultured Clostridium sp.]|nr:Uncharacterised protein [uncultured Clostridium sp.]